jgi:hypothetical protein
VFVPFAGRATTLRRIRRRGLSLTPKPRWQELPGDVLRHRPSAPTMARLGIAVGNVDYQEGQSLPLIGVRVGKTYRDPFADQPVAFARRSHELGSIEDRDLPTTVLY